MSLTKYFVVCCLILNVSQAATIIPISDGQTLFVSGRRDGHLHIFNTFDLKLLKSIPLGENYHTALAGGVQVK